MPEVTIAIPVWQNRVSPVLDTATRLLVVRRRNGQEAGRREMVLGPLPPEALARTVAELHVDMLMCAALSEVLRRALDHRGVRVRPHLCGEIEELLRAFDSGRLERPEFRMPGCWGDHSEGCCCRRRAARAGKAGGRLRARRTTD
jgi:predicted Fe-Mo cluster-binding NifX family protein